MSNEKEQGYKGFLLIYCERCGNVHAFAVRERITEAYCKVCHKKISLENLKPLWLHCECGKRIRYMTNHVFSLFDVECIRCGNPVAVWWNQRKGIYETIREEEPKGKRK